MLRREDIEWCQFYWFSTGAVQLPRVLLIGDSIVAGSRSEVADRLAGEVAVAAFSTSKIVGDPAIYRELALALADYPIDLIYLNNGLHGLDCDDELYRRGLADLVDFLRINAPRTRLVWRSSTPITRRDDPAHFDAGLNAVVQRRNRIAEAVMAEREIPVYDLYSVVAGRPELSSGDGFHYNAAGVAVIADHTAAAVRCELGLAQRRWRIGGLETDFPGVISDWHGFRRHDFRIDGVPAVLVEPGGPAAEGRPWLWRARFFGAFPQADLALLRRGWHVAHIQIDELYGSPRSMSRMDNLYDVLTALGLSQRCALAGFSRGGLDAWNWTVRHPERVAALYLDNAVCDFKNWPGDLVRGRRFPEEWSHCLEAWNFTEAEALAARVNPLDNVEPVAAAGVPLLLLCSEADEVVLPEENSYRLEQRFRELGGEAVTIRKPGAGHHPHSLENPEPIIDFILKHR